MRISSKQTTVVAQSIRHHLGENARIWLFGSRLDDAKKGGDLDLYVEADVHSLRNELRCKIELEEVLDMPVDLVVRGFGENAPIARIAKSEGVRI